MARIKIDTRDKYCNYPVIFLMFFFYLHGCTQLFRRLCGCIFVCHPSNCFSLFPVYNSYIQKENTIRVAICVSIHALNFFFFLNNSLISFRIFQMTQSMTLINKDTNRIWTINIIQRVSEEIITRIYGEWLES